MLLDALAADYMATEKISVVYSDGTHSVSILALPGPVKLLTKGPNESIRIEVQGKDFCLNVADLGYGGTPPTTLITPVRGHTITVTENSVARTYAVLPMGDDGCARKVDNNSAWRIHTKLTA